MKRLSLATRAQLPASLRPCAYRPEAHGAGIVHLGVGGFHRAHQAVYTDSALALTGGDWRIIGVSLRHADMRSRLQPQDGLFILDARDKDTVERRLIGAISRLLFAPEQAQNVIAALAAATTRVVTLTITEKGYALDPSTGALDVARADVAADLAAAARPVTALGWLCAGLARRRELGGAGLSILSCDNISGNGRKLQAAVLAFAGQRDPGLADWIAVHCRFPSSMVDRIVPAATDAQRDALAGEIGLRDEAAVFTETHSQWVLEADFAGSIPAWEAAGVELVPDVAPYEQMKLRLLNASHSFLAWVGLLTGRKTIAQALDLPGVRAFLQGYMQHDATPTLQVPKGYPVADFRASVLQRFANPVLVHRCAQVATDSADKVTQRLLPVLRWHLARGRDPGYSLFALAVWMRCLQGDDEAGHRLTIQDAWAERPESATRSWMDLLQDRQGLFGDTFAERPALLARMDDMIRRMREFGVLAALDASEPRNA